MILMKHSLSNGNQRLYPNWNQYYEDYGNRWKKICKRLASKRRRQQGKSLSRKEDPQ